MSAIRSNSTALRLSTSTQGDDVRPSAAVRRQQGVGEQPVLGRQSLGIAGEPGVQLVVILGIIDVVEEVLDVPAAEGIPLARRGRRGRRGLRFWPPLAMVEPEQDDGDRDDQEEPSRIATDEADDQGLDLLRDRPTSHASPFVLSVSTGKDAAKIGKVEKAEDRVKKTEDRNTTVSGPDGHAEPDRRDPKPWDHRICWI